MTRPDRTLHGRLAIGAPLLLDGALGTELERRGATATLPLWSTHTLLTRPDLVREIHREYAAAGAEVLTACTFRTQRRTLERAGLGARAAELTALAVALARAGAQDAGIDAWVAGSAPTLEDCYRPDLVPDADALAREHAEHAEHLAAAGVDLILCETLNTVREGAAAARAARATAMPFFVSFACGASAQLLSGERLEEALDAVASFSPSAILVNCLPLADVAACLPVLASSGFPFGFYPNVESRVEAGVDEIGAELSPDAFADRAATLIAEGARLVGGCCGTRPGHIRAMAARLRQDLRSPS